MNAPLLLRVISAITDGIHSPEEISHGTGLGQRITSELLAFLAGNGVGVLETHSIRFDGMDRMRAAMLAARLGADMEALSKALSWRDFEVLATNILETSGFESHHSYRLKKPRAEIDVVGIKDSMALLVDCKHWRYNNTSTLGRFAAKQAQRAEFFLRADDRDLKFAVPVLLTLHAESVTFVDGVPVVPIVKFRSFLDEMPGYLDIMRQVRA